VLFFKICRGKPQKHGRTVRLNTRKSSGGLGSRYIYIRANTRHIKVAGRKTEEFQIRKFTTKYPRKMLVLVLSRLTIDAM